MKIDAVITWVDGNDPAHRKKRNKYADPSALKSDDVAGDTRFVAVGEIAWCVASLNRFAPWLNKIYIVTDEQNPNLQSFVDREFPEGHIPMEIVDHKVIFRGYESYLPTFNAAAIETMTWRIPGLSDHFIELNDDMILCAPVSPEDFFTEDGKSICYAENANIPLITLTRMLKPKSDGRKKVTFKGVMCNAAVLAGRKWSLLKINHTPRGLRRDIYESYYKVNDKDIIRNIQYRFRHHDMYTPEVLQYSLLSDAGRCLRIPYQKVLFFYQPQGKRSYFIRKMSQLGSFKGKFACFNSMDQASPEELQTIVSWIEERLRVNFKNDYDRD